MRIAVLPPRVAAEIAAGEVIERPASAVKELVENALDAGARSIVVEIERGGIDLIRVTDDGCGLSAEELPVAVQRHATSKLRDAADLAAIHTLGFRGEALPSMVAAADVLIRSRQEGTLQAAELDLRDGGVGTVRPAAAPVGTSITLRKLFGRQPARRAFLRSPAAESAQVAALINRMALAYPHVRFTLSVDGRRTLTTTGAGDLRDVAARVYGPQVGRRLLEVGEHDGDPAIWVSGLAGPPDVARGTRTGITLFVNGRWVTSRRLHYAVESAYETLLTTGRHPVAVVDVRLPPELVDVNVHPAKSEVRFRDERSVFIAVQSAVRRAVAGGAPVPSLSVFAAPNEGVVTWQPEPEAAGDGPEPPQQPLSDAFTAALPLFAQEPVAVTSPDAQATPRRPVMPVLRVVGQVGTTYVVAEGPNGMYLIDQHAAHERVLYERLLAERADRRVEVQGLLAPLTLNVTASQAAVFDAARAALADLGFDVEPFGERTLVLRAVPAIMSKRDPSKAVTELLDALAEPEGSEPGADRTVMTVACHSAVRAGMTLALDEMRELVRLLEECDSPRTCPHGRPTMMHLSAMALDREFRRR